MTFPVLASWQPRSRGSLSGRQLSRAAAVVALLLFLGTRSAALAQDVLPADSQISIDESFSSAPAEPEGEPAAAVDDDESAAAEALETDPEADRVRFTVPFSDESGGGTATGSAGALEYVRQDYVVATGAVEIRYQDMTVQAERVEVDLSAKNFVAEGRVIIDQGPKRLTGETANFDLETKTGTLYEARAFVDPDIFFSGREISKVSEDVYELRQGVITSCPGDSPPWSLKVSKGRVKVDGFARVRNPRMRVRKLPVIYSPYLLFPTNGDRHSGFLLPNLGQSSRRGSMFSLAYFQTLGRSYDATLSAELYGEDYVGLGTEFRYRPTETTGGIFQGYAIDDPIANTVRWKAIAQHTSDDLPYGMRGVLRYNEFSDFNFFREFERDFNNISVRRIDSAGYLTGNWGAHSLNFLVDDRETFINSTTTVTLRQLPELEYRLRSTQIGSLPLYLDVLSSANYFSIDRTGLLNTTYGRADLSPQLTAALSTLPWLSVSVSGGGRATWYEDSLTLDRTAYSGESVTRVFPSAGAQIVGPSFSKIFEKKLGSFGKFKHIIEPRWSYSYTGGFDDKDRIPLFDEIDTVLDRNIFSVALVNRLLAKPDDEALGGAREIMSFELSQAFSLNKDQPFLFSRDFSQKSTTGPLDAKFRFNPSLRTALEARVTYNTLFDSVESASLSSGLRWGSNGLSLTWFARLDSETDSTRTHQARLGFGWDLVPARLRLETQINYDFVLSLLQQQRHVLSYNFQCWGLQLEFREFESLTFEDREVRLAVSLRNIGTFLDLNTGNREQF